MKKFSFVLGGVRSGKSRFALELAKGLNSDNILFVATAEAKDEEMRIRIEKHKRERPLCWKTLEVTDNIGKAIVDYPYSTEGIIIDCITVLLGNVISELEEPYSYEQVEKKVMNECDEIFAAFYKKNAQFIVISNEVGMGVVPAFASGRIYRDMLGMINQKFAALADEVFFLVAGISLKLK